MNQPPDSSPSESKTPAPAAKRVRRISSKPAKSAPSEPQADPIPVAVVVPVPVATAPQAPAKPPAPAPKHAKEDSELPEPKPTPWAEPEGSAGGEPPTKRKRKRRRKGKGGASQGAGSNPPPDAQGDPEGSSRSMDAPAEPARETSSAPQKPSAPRVSYDPSAISKMAWKLYQGEIGEEGIALIDDHDARDLARRCFRLAEIFLDEQARRGR